MSRLWSLMIVASMSLWALMMACGGSHESSDTDTGGDDTGGDDTNPDDTNPDDTNPDDSVLPELTVLNDPLLDWIDSVSTNTVTYTGDEIDMSGYAGLLWTVSSDDADSFNETYPCGSTENAYVVCASGAGGIVAGDYWVTAMELAAYVPLSSTTYDYIFSSIWESDGLVDNDWVCQGIYDWDTYQGADRWYALTYSHSAIVWSLGCTQVQSNQAQVTDTTNAIAIIKDDTIYFFTPSAEIPSATPRYRTVTFAHPGNWSADDRGSDVPGANPTEDLIEPDIE